MPGLGRSQGVQDHLTFFVIPHSLCAPPPPQKTEEHRYHYRTVLPVLFNHVLSTGQVQDNQTVSETPPGEGVTFSHESLRGRYSGHW